MCQMKFQIRISIFLNTSSDPTVFLNIAGLADIRSWRIVLIETITIEVALPILPAITSSYCKVRAHFLLLFGNKHVESKSMVL